VGRAITIRSRLTQGIWSTGGINEVGEQPKTTKEGNVKQRRKQVSPLRKVFLGPKPKGLSRRKQRFFEGYWTYSWIYRGRQL